MGTEAYDCCEGAWILLKKLHCQLAGVAAARNTRDVDNSKIHLLWMFHRPKHTRLPNKLGLFVKKYALDNIVLFY